MPRQGGNCGLLSGHHVMMWLLCVHVLSVAQTPRSGVGLVSMWCTAAVGMQAAMLLWVGVIYMWQASVDVASPMMGGLACAPKWQLCGLAVRADIVFVVTAAVGMLCCWVCHAWRLQGNCGFFASPMMGGLLCVHESGCKALPAGEVWQLCSNVCRSSSFATFSTLWGCRTFMGLPLSSVTEVVAPAAFPVVSCMVHSALNLVGTQKLFAYTRRTYALCSGSHLQR